MLPRLLRRPAPPPDCLIPVPLHPTRLRQRGYNQALEIARPIAARLKIPLEVHAVRRIRATPAQALLPLRERARNVRGAFFARTRFDGRRVAIVDDVMTSGHTANSLAQCLRRAGAEDIEVWVVARA
jgi:ComF family protein